mgnify:FL=1|tara:strand:+ start:377 stop:1081 length:705 start_codon:yes stop_codon:yes gene_type:complete
MAWKYPEHYLEANSPIDMDEVNEDFLSFSQEAGRLNEHNWVQGAVPDREDVSLLAVYRFGKEQTTVAMSLDSGTYVAAWNYASPAADWFPVVPSLHWQVVISKTVTTDSSPVYFGASFQQIGRYIMRTGPQYALRVDGVVIPETMTMTGDASNDPYGANSPTCEFPLSLETIFFATSGEHVFELVVRDPRKARQYSESPDGSTLTVPDGGVDEGHADGLYYVVNREIILWELRR